MGRIEVCLGSVGADHEWCMGCGRRFNRGESMAGAMHDSGDPIGWLCAECVADWKEHGEKSRIWKPKGGETNGESEHRV